MTFRLISTKIIITLQKFLKGNVVTSSFHEVDERNDEIISDIINNYLSEEQPAGSNGEIIADFYYQC